MQAATLFGRQLPDGGTIGVAAPASPYESRSDVLRSVEWWEARGYGVKLAEHVFARDDYLAGDARCRAADLLGLFADPEVDVVQCLQGGYGSGELLPHLDFDLIAANPKPLVGFSDITSLHVAIRQRTGLATFYGNGFLGVGDPATSDFSRTRLLAVLRGHGAGPVPPDPDDPYSRSLRGGTATAPLVGGCLSLLALAMGTPWEVDVEGAILFFEDVGLEPYKLDGLLTQLAQSGKLGAAAGVVVGEMAKSDWKDHPGWQRSRSLEDVLEVHLEPLGVPVLYKLPLGHGKHLATIPLGVTATLDADARMLTFEGSGLTTGGEGDST
jgi:muramoyltetrapeptide carboxypeptidase